MRLSTTGAFARAARSARLRPTPGQTITACVIDRPRLASSRATPAEPNSPFGRAGRASRVASGSSSRGSRTTATPDVGGSDATAAENSFREHLEKDAEENKIVTGPTGLSGARILNQPFVFDETSNITPTILDLVGRDLYGIPDHPICITRRLIESVFPYPTYKNHVATNPVVTTKDNFDVLGFPKDHPGRSRSDTYYIDSTHVLRTHTSAHQLAAFQYMSKNPEPGYTICADVYRRDSIDRSHFPVFHQMEGAHLWAMPEPETSNETRHQRLWRRIESIRADTKMLPKHNLEIIDEAGSSNSDTNPVQVNHDLKECNAMGEHLKRSLEALVSKVFFAARESKIGTQTLTDEPVKARWIEAYFPFTSPSWELEVWWQGQWLEILGCGITQQSIINNAGLKDRVGWAWGIGIERLAMLLFDIPDIRLFWSEDERFRSQFKEGTINRFTPFSKYPGSYQDVSFWLPTTSSPNASPLATTPANTPSSNTGVAAAAGGDSTKADPTSTHSTSFHENDFMEIVRDVAGSLVEDVSLKDEFVNPRTGRKSLCYRINYRSLEKTFTTDEVSAMQEKIRGQLVERFGVELR